MLRQRVQPRWLLQKMLAKRNLETFVGGTELTSEDSDEAALPASFLNPRKKPWKLLPPEAIRPCGNSQNRPLWVCDRIAAEFAMVKESPTFSSRERLVLIGLVDKLSAAIGERSEGASEASAKKECVLLRQKRGGWSGPT